MILSIGHIFLYLFYDVSVLVLVSGEVTESPPYGPRGAALQMFGSAALRSPPSANSQRFSSRGTSRLVTLLPSLIKTTIKNV